MKRKQRRQLQRQPQHLLAAHDCVGQYERQRREVPRPQEIEMRTTRKKQQRLAVQKWVGPAHCQHLSMSKQTQVVVFAAIVRVREANR